MNKCRELRQRLGVRQLDLSRQTKIPRWKISHGECGYYRLTREELRVLMAALTAIAQQREKCNA